MNNILSEIPKPNVTAELPLQMPKSELLQSESITKPNVTAMLPLQIPQSAAIAKPIATAAIPLQIPQSELLQSATASIDLIIPPTKQTTNTQITSTITNKPDNVPNIPDGLYRGRFDTNLNIPRVGLFDTNPNMPRVGLFDTNPNFPQTVETVSYSTSCSSNYITHLFLVVIAIYIALRRNGGFSVGPVLAAFCCPHIYVLYAFYNGFCTIP